MANDATYGFESRFAFAAAGATFDSSSQRFEVISSTIGKTGEILESSGITGKRARREDRTRAGLVRVGGQLVLEPTPRMMDWFLNYAISAESTDTFNTNTADAITGFDMVHDYYGSGISAIKYGELYVNRMSLAFAPGLVRMTLDVIGKTVTTGQTFAAAALNSTAGVDDPLVFYDTASGITVRSGSGTIEIEEGELIVDNALDVKFRNSQTASSIRATDRVVSLVTNLPLTSTTLSTYFGDKAAANATIVFTRSPVTITFTLYNLKNPDESPQVSGKGSEVPLILRSAARCDASNPDIKVTVVGGSL